MEYNRRKAKQLEDLMRLKDQGMPMPPLRESLRPELPYEFNKIKRKKQMFDEDNLKFLKETCERDLVAINTKVEDLVNQLARYGKQLSDLKVVQSRLVSIVDTIKDEEEDEDDCNRRCC